MGGEVCGKQSPLLFQNITSLSHPFSLTSFGINTVCATGCLPRNMIILKDTIHERKLAEICFDTSPSFIGITSTIKTNTTRIEVYGLQLKMSTVCCCMEGHYASVACIPVQVERINAIVEVVGLV